MSYCLIYGTAEDKRETPIWFELGVLEMLQLYGWAELGCGVDCQVRPTLEAPRLQSGPAAYPRVE